MLQSGKAKCQGDIGFQSELETMNLHNMTSANQNCT